MDSIGAEVGQKMRSAIKAKLLELNCYVDEELPDYIMVMVANKRTKSQMNEDLHLFLTTKTSTFVEWLHIVLKKLREVTVTNPEVYRRVIKPRSPDLMEGKVKKEKSHSNIFLKLEKDGTKQEQKFSDERRISIIPSYEDNTNFDDNFDIPLLSEVNMSTQEDLDDLERKIKSVKSRLGMLVESDAEDELTAIQKLQEQIGGSPTDRNVQLLLIDNEKRHSGNLESENRRSIEDPILEKRRKHTPITFDIEPQKHIRKRSILDRLGRRLSDEGESRNKKFRRSSESRKEEDLSKSLRERRELSSRDRAREHRRSSNRNDKGNNSSVYENKKDRNKSVLSRLGVMSKVSVPYKEPLESEPEDELKTRDVRSVVQVKPRVIPADIPQPSKNLLLKAVAEAQKSIENSRNTASRKLCHSPKSVKQIIQKSEGGICTKNLSTFEKVAQQNQQLTDDDSKEYSPVQFGTYTKEIPKYVPSPRKSVEESLNNDEENQNFIVTLDGVHKPLVDNISKTLFSDEKSPRPSAKSRLERRKSPSPITFDRSKLLDKTKTVQKTNVPDRLPIVNVPQSVKNKERCKFWPNCRQGDKCEYVHPTSDCETFPNCKFGANCIFAHPHCKFGTSCTKRDCPFSHTKNEARVHTSLKMSPATTQVCKYTPNCVKPNCAYYHPKPCMYGKYCKNQAACGFSHTPFIKPSMTWRLK